ncbi:antimicrobial peptide NK-lysin-like [Neoarius graeffei]|uniref:antimicrobial peptide NK-lysin-like n=1 Tax=Neoarius graeffei TaxID=443677 RepID=UPI00298D1149|nr:antimicrobial peptide NK-lysin-like [Neoarius graeffei]
MLWKLLVASFFLGSACAMHLEYLKVDSAGELAFTLDSTDQDEDLLMPEEQLPGVCWACKWVMRKLKKQLGNKADVATTKEKLTQVCDSIGFLRSLCKKMIRKYLDVLVEELSTSDGPETACVNIGVC